MNDQNRKEDLTRRDFLKIAGAAGALVSVGGVAAACGSSSSSGTTASPAAGNAPDVITFGVADALSGFYAPDTRTNGTTQHDLWAKNVNEQGGIYIKEFDKKIPVKVIYYDNKSDASVAVKMYQKLMTDDKVDFIFGPGATFICYAVAPLANSMKYPMIDSQVSDNDLYAKTVDGDYPYYFQNWNPPSVIIPLLVDAFKEMGVKSVACFYIASSFGTNYNKSIQQLCPPAGIEVKVSTSYPPDVMDVSPMVKSAQQADVDCVVCASYGTDGRLFQESMMSLDYNPKALMIGSTTYDSPLYIQKFGIKAMEGIIGECGWNATFGNPPYTIPGAPEYQKQYKAEYGYANDVGCGPVEYGACQVLQQAIEKAGTLDRDKVREVLATETFTDTLLSDLQGNFHFTNNVNADMQTIVGQWQDGEYVTIAPAKNRLAAGIQYPKAPWPKG